MERITDNITFTNHKMAQMKEISKREIFTRLSTFHCDKTPTRNGLIMEITGKIHLFFLFTLNIMQLQQISIAMVDNMRNHVNSCTHRDKGK